MNVISICKMSPDNKQHQILFHKTGLFVILLLKVIKIVEKLTNSYYAVTLQL